MSKLFGTQLKFSELVLWLFVGTMFLFGAAHAANTVTGATVDGGASTTVVAGAAITLSVTNTTSNGTDWGSTNWYIGTSAPGTWNCDADPTPTIAANGSNTVTLGSVTAPATAGTYNVYFRTASDSSNCSNNRSTIFTLANSVIVVTPPTATTAPATSLTATGATLNGAVSSNGASTAVSFDYGLTATYGSTVTATASPLAANAVNSAATAAVTGLSCNTLYHFRVKGVNSAGTGNGADATFTTSPCAPSVTTNAASALSISGVTLNGTVSSNGASTAVTFDYGLTVAYGSTATATASPLAGSATNTAISVAITGLSCSTTYHYRVIGVNSAGTTPGADRTLTTSTCPVPVVVSINTASGSPIIANMAVSWTVTFNTSVTGVDATDFALVQGGGVTGATITSVTGSGTTWTVLANTGSGTGTLGMNLVDNDSIINAASVPLGGVGSGNGNFTGQVYTVSAPVPVLTKVVSTSAAAVGDLVTFTIAVTNPYGVDLSSITVSDVLPTGMAYAAHVATQGAAAISAQTVTWTIPTLPAGSSAQLTLVVSLSQQGTLTNTATSPGAVAASASVLVLNNAVTYFHLDEPAGSWTGRATEVIDSGGTHLNGRRLTTSTPTTTNTVVPTPTIASQYPAVVGGFCNAGRFDGNAVVEVADSPLFDYTTKLSASVWIYPTAYPSEYSSILSNDQNYEFHLDPNGRLYWWWGASNFTSATIVPLNRWTHVAITLDSSATGGRQRIYINGVLDANTNNWKGTLTANNCNFYIGGDVTTGTCALIPGRNFHGMIDEVKLYGYELSAAEVQADMTFGRNCSGDFDHIRIEHDGSGSVCTPETVTVKACLNAACTTLYPGNVTVTMSQTGWVGGVLTNGVGTMSLSNSTAGNITLGTSSTSPAAGSATRCFNGGTETCTMNFANASCNFDAVETAANPKTRLFTKLAGANFSVDVLALSGSSVNTGYTGTVNADLVDTSTSSCPTGSGLTTPAQAVTFAAGNAGRKNVVFNYATPMKNVRVRMQVGSSTPACSTDNFAIRPSSVSLLTSPAMAAAPSATASPTLQAGSSFDLNATATAGYTGTLTLDASKLTAQTTTQGSTVASGGGVGALTPSSLAVNASPAPTGNASYDEVGYVYLAAGAYRDEAFTAVDQPTGCAATSPSTCDCVTDATTNNNLSTSLVGSTGRYGCYIGSSSASLGRFIPDHFNTSIVAAAGVPMSCPTGLTCPTSGFVYSGQPFPLEVTATNSANATTANYEGVFAKTVTLSPVASVGGAAIATPAPGGTLSANTAAASSFASGSNAATRATPVFTFAGMPTAPTDVYLRAVDADGVSSLRSTASNSVEGGVKVVSGRIRIPNVYGSERLPLPMTATVQYYNGIYWLTSATDSTTLFDSHLSTAGGNLVAAIVTGPLALSGVVVNNPATSAFAAGIRTVTLAAPLVAGSANISLNSPSYLPSAPARATFGVYKSPLIYRRENY